MRTVQGRQIRRQPLLDGRALPGLHSLPRLTLPTFFVEVRVAAPHLCDQPVGDIANVESAALLGHDRMEQYLEQHVAQLLAHLGVVAVTNRVVELVRLLDQIGAQRIVGLVRVPLAPRPQIAH